MPIFQFSLLSGTRHQGVNRPCRQKYRQDPQRGVVLVVVLIFMLALSTLAIFSARNVTLGERQSRNEVEFQVARQSAEAALRDAEADLSLQGAASQMARPNAVCSSGGRGGNFREAGEKIIPDGGEFTSDCLRGQCALPVARYNVAWNTATATNRGEPWWPVTKGGNWNNNFSTKPSRENGDTNCATFTGAVSLGVFTGRPPVPGVARQPEYLIEYILPYQETIAAGASPLQFKVNVPVKTISSSGEPILMCANCGPGSSNKLPKEATIFRITARGFGASTRGTNNIPATEVMLQSYFSVL